MRDSVLLCLPGLSYLLPSVRWLLWLSGWCTADSQWWEMIMHTSKSSETLKVALPPSPDYPEYFRPATNLGVMKELHIEVRAWVFLSCINQRWPTEDQWNRAGKCDCSVLMKIHVGHVEPGCTDKLLHKPREPLKQVHPVWALAGTLPSVISVLWCHQGCWLPQPKHSIFPVRT